MGLVKRTKNNHEPLVHQIREAKEEFGKRKIENIWASSNIQKYQACV
jgi:hypothetical protein